MTTTDHAAEALRLVHAQQNMPTPEATFAVVEAHVHAQLAIAEQQRIANLIALAESEHVFLIEGPANQALFALAEFNKPEDPYDSTMTLRDDIKKGLGL